jgi:1-acyl-sn-glycerol-3-phosphate acyltransferase
MKTEFNPFFFLLTRKIARTYLRARFKIEILGLEHFPVNGPAVVVPKHQRWEDVPLLGVSLPAPLYYLAKEELFRSTFSRHAISWLGGLPLDRKGPMKSLSTFRTLKTLLYAGDKLVLFIEGTYYPGVLGPGKHRLVQMILDYQKKDGLPPIPFVPVGISYQSRDKKLRPKVRISIAPPLKESDPSKVRVFTRDLLLTLGRHSGLLMVSK